MSDTAAAAAAAQTTTAAPASEGDSTPSAESIRKEILEAQQDFEEDHKKNGLYVSPKIKFRYAVALSKSDSKDDWFLARCYFNDLWQVGYQVRDSRLEIARLHLKLGDYRRCRLMCQQLMALPNDDGEPGKDARHVAEVQQLHDEVVEMVWQQGKKGLATVSVLALVLGGVVLMYRRPDWFRGSGGLFSDKSSGGGGGGGGAGPAA